MNISLFILFMPLLFISPLLFFAALAAIAELSNKDKGK